MTAAPTDADLASLRKWTVARHMPTLDALIAERDRLRARVAQLDAALECAPYLRRELTAAPQSTGVEHVPETCGGRAVLTGTRMPVWCLARLSAEQARTMYPHLTDEQIAAAHAYAKAHPDELARDIAEQQSTVERAGVCATCKGRGHVANRHSIAGVTGCLTCHGTGRATTREAT